MCISLFCYIISSGNCFQEGDAHFFAQALQVMTIRDSLKYWIISPVYQPICIMIAHIVWRLWTWCLNIYGRGIVQPNKATFSHICFMILLFQDISICKVNCTIHICMRHDIGIREFCYILAIRRPYLNWKFNYVGNQNQKRIKTSTFYLFLTCY